MQQREESTVPFDRLESVVLHNDVLKYVDVGQGRPVVLVHGLLGSHESWGPQIDMLAEKYRVIVPNLFGHGESDKPPGDYSLSAHAATLRDLMDHLDLPTASFVGHSLGGGIVMQLFYLFPDRVRAAVPGRQRRARSRGEFLPQGGQPAR